MGESSLLLADSNNNLFYLAQNKPHLYYISEAAAAAAATSGVQNTIIGRNGHHHNHAAALHSGNSIISHQHQHHIGTANGNRSNKSRNTTSIAATTRDNSRQAVAPAGVAGILGANINSLNSLSSLISIMHGSQALQQTQQHMIQQSMNNHNTILQHSGGLPHTVPANTASIADYLAQLIKDRKQLTAFPNVFLHVERILDEEICKVRASLFQISGRAKEPLVLPDPDGPVIAKTEKVYVPVKEHPDFNFVGRILGPRGMTAKQLEQETGCKIMVRGKGSMRDKKKEDANRGKPNWEHLNDELHVVISVEDTEKRADVKIQRAVEEVQKLLVPVTEGEDELKKRQLMELAIINGTYRDSSSLAFPGATAGLDAFLASPQELQRLFSAAAAASVGSVAGVGGVGGVGAPVAALAASPLRTGTPLGAPLILSSSRLPAGVLNGVPGGGSGAPPPTALMGADPSLLYHHAATHHYTPADYHQYANALLTASSQGQQALEAYGAGQGAGTPVTAVGQDVTGGKQAGGRRGVSGVRDHPYQRAV